MREKLQSAVDAGNGQKYWAFSSLTSEVSFHSYVITANFYILNPPQGEVQLMIVAIFLLKSQKNCQIQHSCSASPSLSTPVLFEEPLWLHQPSLVTTPWGSLPHCNGYGRNHRAQGWNRPPRFSPTISPVPP